jgi:hypothetical protein
VVDFTILSFPPTEAEVPTVWAYYYYYYYYYHYYYYHYLHHSGIV